MYNLEVYPAENIWWQCEISLIFAIEKKTYLRHITAIAGQSVKNRGWRKPFQLSLSYRNCGGIFCNHSGASDCSAVTFAPLSHRIHTSRPKSGLTLYDSTPMGRTLSHNPKSVCLKFATGSATYANTIGVRVHTRHLHRCRCLCSSVTLAEAINTPMHHTHDS